ncbi:MAG: SBBP repeat-containing protein [bacterium]
MKKHLLNIRFSRVSIFILLTLPGILTISLVGIFWKSESISNRQRTIGTEPLPQLPMRFEKNMGQADAEVDFLYRDKFFSLFLRPEQAVMFFHSPETKSGSSRNVNSNTSVSMLLVNANPEAKAEGREKLVTKTNYLISNNPEKWRTAIPNYGKVKFSEIYPGIDLDYHGQNGNLEYDFNVSPGANPDAIALQFEAPTDVKIDESGNLVLKAGTGTVTMQAPVAYQEFDGERAPVVAEFVLRDAHTFGFELGEYDTSVPLVIDPVLVYSTFVSNVTFDSGNDIAVDKSGFIYVTGSYADDVFVTKLHPDSSALIYSTVLGGDLDDTGLGIAVDTAGYVYITGETESDNFPTHNAVQSEFGGSLFVDGDAFITKLNPDGSVFVYSTYLGGSVEDIGRDIAIDLSGNAYVTGTTNSGDNFPLVNPLQPILKNFEHDAFVTKINADGSAFVFSTYLGGSGDDEGNGIAVDADRNIYLTGQTISMDYPTVNAYQEAALTGFDAFVTKMNAAGTALVYSTYLTGVGNDPNFSHTDKATAIAVDTSGQAYVVGETFSPDFPTLNAVQSDHSGQLDGFVTKFTADGRALVFSTYLGGTEMDYDLKIALDAAGNAFVTGKTRSTNFPTAQPIQAALNGPLDAFVTGISSDGLELLFSSYLGGSSFDEGRGIDVSANGNLYLTGSSSSDDFPVVSPLQASKTRGAVVSIIGSGDEATLALPSVAFLNIGPAETEGRASIEVSNTSAAPVVIQDITVSPTPPFAVENPGLPFELAAGATLEINVFLTSEPDVAQEGLLTITSNASTLRVKSNSNSTATTTATLKVRKIDSMNFSGVAIDLDQPTSDFFPPQSDFTKITIKGTNLDKVNDIDFLPVENNAIIPQNIEARENEVTFELRVRHNAVLSERDIVLFTDDFQEIQVSNLLGSKFLVTAVRSQFNQGIDIKNQVVERDGRLDLFENKLVAWKQGAVRIQFEDANQLNRVFKGELIEADANNSAEQVWPHRAKNDYDWVDLLVGLDYLTLPFPKPLKKGTRKFTYILERDDGLPILGPVIEKDAIESRELRIRAISYKITKPDGSVLMPPSDAAVNQSLELLKKLYPISPHKIKFYHAGTEDFPDIGEFDDIFETSGTATNIKNSGRDLLAKAGYEELDDANEEALINDTPDFHLQLVFLPDIGKDWAGVAYARFQTALIATTSSTKSMQKVVPHEIGHLLAAVLNKDFELPESLQRELKGELGLGDEYNGGVYYCNVNPPVKQNKGWVTGKDESCASSPFDLNIDGDGVGIYTNLSAYNPYDQRTKFTDKDLSPEIINYNIMGSQGDAKTWVSNLTYSRFMKYLVPSEADNETIARVAVAQNDGIQINGVIFRNGGGSIDRVVKTTSHYRSPETGGAYSVDLLDANDNILSSKTFSATFVTVSEPPAESESELFNIQMDFVEQVQKVSLKKDGLELASHTLSNNAPEVQILQPASYQVFTDEIEINWTASDADGDSLAYSIIYETDDGVYLPVVAGLRDTSYTWNLTSFPGSLAGTIIVVANDGFHRARDRQFFGKARSAPTIAIIAPNDGATVSGDSVLIIAATGYDLEDGLLPDSAFVFTSDVDGVLGQGSPLLVSSLSTGQHTITASAADKDGKTGSDSVTISYLVTSVDSETENRLPEDFALYQNYPNPFNPSTIIRFDLPNASDVKVTIFNVLGQQVKVLTDRKYAAGQHQLKWNGLDRAGLVVASGIYIYRIESGSRIFSRKMLLVR